MAGLKWLDRGGRGVLDWRRCRSIWGGCRDEVFLAADGAVGRGRLRQCRCTRSSRPCGCARRRADAGHLYETHRPYPAALLPGLPSSRINRADVVDHVPGRSTLGEEHQAEDLAAGDAAVVPREERWHSEVQG